MGITSSSLNISNSNMFRNIPTPLVNNAEISRGAFITPSAITPSISNTAFGTNANPIIDQDFITSTDIFLQNQANTATASNLREKTSTTQTTNTNPTSLFTSSNNIFSTSSAAPEISPTSQTISNVTNNNPIQTFSPTSNIKENTFPISTTLLDRETSTNAAAVKADFNVQLSPQANESLKALQTNLSLFNAQTSITSKMDGMIPLAASILSDFSSSTPSTSRNLNLFDTITETFNKILSGGGHSGSGFTGREKEEESAEQQKQKPKKLNLLS